MSYQTLITYRNEDNSVKTVSIHWKTAQRAEDYCEEEAQWENTLWVQCTALGISGPGTYAPRDVLALIGG